MLRAYKQNKQLVIVQPHTGGWIGLQDVELDDLDVPISAKGVFPEAHYNILEKGADESQIAILLDSMNGGRQEKENEGELNSIIIKLTNACNQSCTYCYDAKGAPVTDVNVDLVLDALKQTLEICSPTLSIIFHGGEPLMRFGFIKEIVEQLELLDSNKSLTFSLQTNGSVLNDEIVSFLKKHNFSVGVSVDGDLPTHNTFRIMQNGRGTYELFEKQFLKHKDFFLDYCGILTTVTRNNVKEIPSIIKHFRDLGFSTWGCTLFEPVGRGANFDGFSLSAIDYCESLGQVLDMIEDGQFDSLYIEPIMVFLDNLLLGSGSHMCYPGNSGCGAGSELLNISANGDVNGCDVISDKSLDFGSIDKKSILECYESDNANVVRGRHRNLTQCHNCTWLGVCGGTCIGRSSITTIDSVECQISQYIYPNLISRLSSDSNKLLDYYTRFRGQT